MVARLCVENSCAVEPTIQVLRYRLWRRNELTDEEGNAVESVYQCRPSLLLRLDLGDNELEECRDFELPDFVNDYLLVRQMLYFDHALSSCCCFLFQAIDARKR